MLRRKYFLLHVSSGIERLPALIHIEEEFPAQTLNEDQEFSIKEHIVEEVSLAQIPGKKGRLLAEINTDMK